MAKVFGKEVSKISDGESAVTMPRVTRVTPEGRLLYDPISVLRSEPARKHLIELEKKNPAEPRPNKP